MTFFLKLQPMESEDGKRDTFLPVKVEPREQNGVRGHKKVISISQASSSHHKTAYQNAIYQGSHPCH